MSTRIPMLIAVWSLLRLPETALAQGGGYLQFKPQSGVNVNLLVVVLVVVVVGIAVLALVYNVISRARRKAPVKVAQQKKKVNFQKHAAKLGFKIAEIKTMRLIANKITPQDPDSLLTTDAGRERLTADIWARIRRREREIEFLRRIQDKLTLMRERGLQERATIRVETDLSVWIVKKTDAELVEAEEEGDLFTDVEQIGGKLLDLSEGGAAVTADLDAGMNDLVELWSADVEIWIPPVTAGVLQIQRSSAGKNPIFHLHFIDPPLSELRIALQALQRNAGIHTS